MNIRREEYSYKDVPFCFYTDLNRVRRSVPPDINWHDSIEIQLCNNGSGNVFVDGTIHPLDKTKLIVINSNSMHYTVADEHLNYSALIISLDFCEKMGFDCSAMVFDTMVQDEYIIELVKTLQEIYVSEDILYLTAKEISLILQILIELAEKYCKQGPTARTKERAFAYVKSAINFIHNNYNSKIQLDDISREICVDKYFLSRIFKAKTGKTIVEYINTYRCNRAACLIMAGCNVSEAANLCGFDNFSYFTKTFKKIVGILPSKLNKTMPPTK